jgi:hypothetical protein
MNGAHRSVLFYLIYACVAGLLIFPGSASGDASTLSLGAEWNFISFPRLPADTAIEHVLPGDVAAQVVVAWGYDNVAKQWKKWKPSGSGSNTLTNFEIGKGYWLYLSTDRTIDISTWSVPVSPVVVHLYHGWNLTGYHGTSGISIASSLADLEGGWSIVWNWDSGQWSARHSSLNTLPFPALDAFTRSRAYWVGMKAGQQGDWVQKIVGGPSSSLCGDIPALPAGSGEDLEVKESPYCVRDGSYNYGFVNIHGKGSLIFEDATIDFWTKSILVEASGNLIVGTSTHPIGTNNPANVVTIHLYGDESQTRGITCRTTTGNTTNDKICGVPGNVWSGTPYRQRVDLPGNVNDEFYDYKTLPTDTPNDASGNWFGLKTLAVSYGGTLRMFGKKGATYSGTPTPTSSGTSWTRLDGTVQPHGTTLVLDRPVDWQTGDRFVVTTTDYLPGHSEAFTMGAIGGDGKTITVQDASGFQYIHNGVRYDLKQHSIPTALEITADSVETRAAVALLSRNIRIVSAGSSYGDPFPDTGWFGGHTIVRQGFQQYQVQGVEFYQLGQGGRIAHSPVNFHLTRLTPSNTFVKDCSVWDSMTRWYELRGTQNVTLERNVGYKSIGHGYFLADGVETNNTLKANIGIYARPAVQYDDDKYRDNPRKVPGIFALKDFPGPEFLKYAGDAIHPSVFFISNGYNTFEDNMAAGAGACGACYWIAPVAKGTLALGMGWYDYADIQSLTGGTAPLKTFKGNFCSTAQHSLITIEGPGSCKGVQTLLEPDTEALKPVWNLAYGSDYRNGNPDLYPQLNAGASYQPRRCVENSGGLDCDQNCAKGQTNGCAVTAIENYTSSFHWASTNVSAIWLRTNWFLFTGGALTDVLNGGLSMVSGGSYDQVVNGYWGLTRKSVFIGHTQTNNDYATNAGPVNGATGLTCSGTGAYCLLGREGISFPTENFSVYQRLYNIYDGPVYQEKNAYLHIKETLVDCGGSGGNCNSSLMYGSGGRGMGIPKAKDATSDGRIKVGDCILPNAAVGWKQPNGFYYPPAFHSSNLYFDDVDLRHFIIIPLFRPGTNTVSDASVQSQYCSYPPGDPKTLFASNFTDVDRQTELNDDDGTLSGLKGTISVNNDQFFWVPLKPDECLSEQTCFQVPYDYVTAVVYPDCATNNSCAGKWDAVCETTACYGVPIYRQLLNKDESRGVGQSIRMAGAGISQRSTMVYNKGVYYIDTASSETRQKNSTLSLFRAGKSYNFFLMYAKPTTRVTFQIYVGQGFADTSANISMVRAGSTLADGVVLTKGNPDPGIHFTPGTWPSGWTKTYDGVSGILTVTTDMTGNEFVNNFNAASQESCRPASFCTWRDNACKCAQTTQDDTHPTTVQSDATQCDAVCEWSVKATECPSGGCYGFRVTLPGSFVADDNGLDGSESVHRPAPANFLDASRRSDWCLTWDKVSQGGAGQSKCDYVSDPLNPALCPP